MGDPMEDERLDLSALDPSSDPGWDAIVAATVARAGDVAEKHAQRDDPIRVIVGWRRELLIAAAAAIAILVPVELMLELREQRVARAHGLAIGSAHWAVAPTAPTGAEILRSMATRGTP